MVSLFLLWFHRSLTLKFINLSIYVMLSNAWLAWWSWHVLIVTLGIEFFSSIYFIYFLIFYRPIRGSSGSIRACMFLSLVNASLDSLHIYLALVSASFIRVGRRCMLSSHTFYSHLLVRLESSHWVVFFTRFIPTHWYFRVNLSTMLRYWGLSL